MAFGSGVIDGGVEPTEPCDRLIDQLAHLVIVAHIGADEFRLGAEGA
jgi:hypothetical protein